MTTPEKEDGSLLVLAALCWLLLFGAAASPKEPRPAPPAPPQVKAPGPKRFLRLPWGRSA